MITIQDIQALQAMIEETYLYNDALKAAFINTTDPTVTVTLPDNTTLTLPCYLPLVQKVEQLKSISLGLSATPSDDYQILLNDVTNSICQISRMNPIVPNIEVSVSLVDDYFDIDGDSSQIGVRVDFTKKIQGSTKFMIAEFVNGSDVNRFMRPIQSDNKSSAKIGIVSTDPGGSSNIVSITTIPGVTLSVGETIVISGQICNVLNIAGVVVTLDRVITTAQNATVYNMFPADNIWAMMPLKNAPILRLAVISDHRMSEFVQIDFQDILESTLISGTPADQLVTGTSNSSMIQNVPGSLILPIPAANTAPTLTLTPPNLSNSQFVLLNTHIQNFFAEWSLYKEHGDMSYFANAIGIYQQAKVYAGVAKNVLLQPFTLTASHPDIAISYEFRYRTGSNMSWKHYYVSIPMMTQAQASVAVPWNAEFSASYDQPDFMVQARVIFMYRQPTQVVSSIWSPIFGVNESTPGIIQSMSAYQKWQQMMMIGSLNTF